MAKKQTLPDEKLKEVAKDLKKMVNETYEPCLNTLNNNWDGANAERYLNKGYNFENRIRSFISEIQETANVIKDIRTNAKNAEKTGVMIVANKRKK